MRRLVWAFVFVWPALASGQEQGPGSFRTDFYVRLNPPTQTPSIAMAPDGRFVVVEQGRLLTQPPGEVGVYAQRFDRSGQALGGVFQVSSSPMQEYQFKSTAIAMDAAGAFTVLWAADPPVSSSSHEIFGQRYDANGVARGGEFRVNFTTAGNQGEPALALTASGEGLAVWVSADENGSGIYGQRYDASGGALGAEFRVNSFTTDMQFAPSVAAGAGGGFVVVWQGRGQDGSADGVFGQILDGNGAPLGAEFRANTYTTGIQAFPAVAALADGNFVLAWVSSETVDGAGPGAVARRYDASGVPLGAEFRVGTQPPRLTRKAVAVTPDGGNGFAVAWQFTVGRLMVRRYQGSGVPVGEALGLEQSFGFRGGWNATLASDGAGRLLIFGQDADTSSGSGGALYDALWPSGLEVDSRPGGSDRNGILEPGESVVVAPTWRNQGAANVVVSGTLDRFDGPGAPTTPAYVVVDGTATYGSVAPGAAVSCTDDSLDCYMLNVTVPTVRPVRHMDAGFHEILSVGGSEAQSRCWQVHVGGSFDDVPRTSPFYRAVETLVHFGITGGCTASSFCPKDPTTRQQGAAILLASKFAPRPGLQPYFPLLLPYVPPRPARGVFHDVPAKSHFAPWIEDLWNRGLDDGCAPGLFCPRLPVTRAQIARMLLRTREGSSYAPPACKTPVFSDVPCSDPFAPWIDELFARGIATGCGGGRYCPGDPVPRAQMADLVMKTFALDLNAQSELPAPGPCRWSPQPF